MFINVNGVELFYEQVGQGDPIILLHGNGESHELFNVLINQLSNCYTVYAIDSRGHGKSSPVEEIAYQSMADDIVAFIDKLKLKKPILYGHSDGGILGLLIASQHPDCLSKLMISGANIYPRGLKNNFIFSCMKDYIKRRDPKTKMILTQPNIKVKDISKIKIPTLVLAGVDDIVKEKHTKLIASHIPTSTLQIIQGEGHGSYVADNAKLYKIIAPYLGK